MAPRALGALLALAAVVAFAVSIATSAWWAGHPVVEGRPITAKDVHVGLLGAEGCNTGGDGSCEPVPIGTTYKLATYGELAIVGLTALLALALAISTWTVGDRRKGLARATMLMAVLAGSRRWHRVRARSRDQSEPARRRTDRLGTLRVRRCARRVAPRWRDRANGGARAASPEAVERTAAAVAPARRARHAARAARRHAAPWDAQVGPAPRPRLGARGRAAVRLGAAAASPLRSAQSRRGAGAATACPSPTDADAATAAGDQRAHGVADAGAAEPEPGGRSIRADARSIRRDGLPAARSARRVRTDRAAATARAAALDPARGTLAKESPILTPFGPASDRSPSGPSTSPPVGPRTSPTPPRMAPSTDPPRTSPPTNPPDGTTHVTDDAAAHRTAHESAAHEPVDESPAANEPTDVAADDAAACLAADALRRGSRRRPIRRGSLRRPILHRRPPGRNCRRCHRWDRARPRRRRRRRRVRSPRRSRHRQGQSRRRPAPRRRLDRRRAVAIGQEGHGATAGAHDPAAAHVAADDGECGPADAERRQSSRPSARRPTPTIARWTTRSAIAPMPASRPPRGCAERHDRSARATAVAAE